MTRTQRASASVGNEKFRAFRIQDRRACRLGSLESRHECGNDRAARRPSGSRGYAVNKGSELAIVLTDDSAMRLLNRNWRGIDASTNVLSFPTGTGSDKTHLGDIVLAYETIAREARAERKPLAHHVAHLAVHGFLHLVGYDHERDKDALAMEQAEREILRRLAIPDPYQARTRHAAKSSAKHPTKRPVKA